MPTTNSTTPMRVRSALMPSWSPGSIGCGGGQFPGPGARPGVRGEYVVDGQFLVRGYVVFGHHPGHGVDDPQERQPAVPERLHTDLVGGVEHGRRRPAAGPGLAGQLDRGERLVVERQELPAARLGPVPRRRRRPVSGRASPGRARSAAASSGGDDLRQGRAVARTRPSSARPTAGARRRRSGPSGCRRAGAPRSAPAPCSPGWRS